MKHPVHDNFYARRDGTPYAAPLANRGPEALQELLVEQRDRAAAQLRLLTRSELVSLAAVADRLAHMARATVEEVWPGYLGRTVDVTPDPRLHACEVNGSKGCAECADRARGG